MTTIALPAAYVLARRRGILTTFGLGWILLSQMFPLILIIIPLFLLLIDLGLTNSHLGLVLVYTVWALPFVLWMLQSYVRGIPRDLEEAARVDGASRFQILVGIIAPLLAPGIVVTTLFAFITAWNEFFLALVVLQSADLYTLPLKLKQFVGIEGIVRPACRRGRCSRRSRASSCSRFIQRWLTRGPVRGGEGLVRRHPDGNPGVERRHAGEGWSHEEDPHPVCRARAVRGARRRRARGRTKAEAVKSTSRPTSGSRPRLPRRSRSSSPGTSPTRESR